MPRGYRTHESGDRFEREAEEWDDDRRPRRRGPLARLVSLVKLALFLTPVTLFAASYLVTDCGSRAGSGLVQMFRAGACARGAILSGALSLPDDLGALRRAMH
ncbi:hypothetical protein [uncultured Methylobacterium sp.]|uniref:hypothetical protein n=1 Tax=uncultured Methylobacterium sp. TaxID=157278 RepID=UPI0035C960D6